MKQLVVEVGAQDLNTLINIAKKVSEAMQPTLPDDNKKSLKDVIERCELILKVNHVH